MKKRTKQKPAAGKKKPAAGKKQPAAGKKQPVAGKKQPAVKQSAGKGKPAPVEEVSLAGWEAIDAALTRAHGSQEPKHYGTIIKWALGGPDPLDGISAFRVDGPIPHWHIVGYGLSELYEKTSDDPSESGWGFELTFRVARGPDEDAPPMWALNVLQNLARYVFDSGNTFAPGHHMDLNGPIALERETAIRAALFAEDPQLPPIDTPHGRLAFVQVVGITEDELDAVVRWNCTSFLQLLSARYPLLVTDLQRGSILADPALRAEVEARIASEGSSVGVIYVGGKDEGLGWRLEPAPALVVGAKHVPALQALLRGRTGRGEEFWLLGREHRLHVTPGAPAQVRTSPEDPGCLEVTLPSAQALALAGALAPTRGTYAPEGLPLLVEVVPTEILDDAGNVVRVVG